MTTFKKQFVAAVSAGTMLLSMATPVFAETTLEVTGNGAYSNSDVVVNTNRDVKVEQSNKANVTNNINTSSDTGSNDANYNTNGDVTVRTGDAKSKVEVENMLNSNRASVDCCATSDFDAKISGNGAQSDNDIRFNNDKNIKVEQDNDAYVRNDVDAKTNTGKNDAYGNTSGDVTIMTGDAKTDVAVKTQANANWAVVSGDSSDNAASLRVLDNGAYSDNYVKVDFDNSIKVEQDNDADVKNEVDAYAKTGYNEADYNTGDEVAILTGDAKTTVGIDNMVNFNWADVDCGCVLDLMAKVAGNGYDSDNDIKAYFDDKLTVDQGGRDGNDADLDNAVWAKSATGKNEANSSTGSSDSDPLVWTGDSDSNVSVENSGNVNSYGSEMPSDWTDWDLDFSMSFDLGDLMAWFAAHHS